MNRRTYNTPEPHGASNTFLPMAQLHIRGLALLLITIIGGGESERLSVLT